MGLIGSSYRSLQRRLGHRWYYLRLRDWMISLYDTLLRRFKGWPLPMRGKVCGVHLRGVGGPVFLRLGSSDGFVI